VSLHRLSAIRAARRSGKIGTDAAIIAEYFQIRVWMQIVCFDGATTADATTFCLPRIFHGSVTFPAETEIDDQRCADQ
jgi:hypothetical protein